MFKKASFGSRTFFVRTVAVVLCIAMALCLSPYEGLNVLADSAVALALPEYNPALGTFTESGGVLTATPYEYCAFRGWYEKATGKEVSTELSFTLPSGKTKDYYVPVFYNLNVIIDGTYEDYEVGANLKNIYVDGDIWDGCTDGSVSNGESGDWTSVTVTNERAKNGTKSLKIMSRINTAFRTVSGLDKNARYKVEFYFNLDPAGTSDGVDYLPYLNYVNVMPGDAVVTPRSNEKEKNLGQLDFDSTTGSCAEGEWKKASFTFFTGENTDVIVCFQYLCDAVKYLYIDDFAIVREDIGSPTYANDNFSTGYAPNWSVDSTKKFTITAQGGNLQINEPTKGNYGYIESPGFYVKKGYDYTIKFRLDLSGVTQPNVQQYDSEAEEYVYDENGDPVWEVHNAETGGLSANWINFSVTNTPNTYGADGKFIVQSSDTSKPAFTSKVYNDSTPAEFAYIKQNTGAALGYGKDTIKNGGKETIVTRSETPDICEGFLHSIFGHKDECYSKTTTYSYHIDPDQPLNVELSFTATDTSFAYFHSRLNGRGTYSIDDFQIIESGSGDIDSIILDNVETVGTAIRTEGIQGLRYKTSINKKLLTANNEFGVRVIEYGTVAIRKHYLNGQELKIDTSYTVDGKTSASKKGVAYSFANGKDSRYAESNKNIQYTGVLMNIAEKFYNSDYTIRSYFIYKDANGNTKTIYSEPTESTVYIVSKYAYGARNDKGEYNESEQTREYLYNNIISKFSDKVVKVNNSQAPIYNGFQGIRSTIYHATTFFPDSHGRTYTEEQAAVEMDRLVDSKVDNVRTRFASQWMWKAGYGWDWESTKMQAYYKWGKMLQDRKISITLQAGWHLNDFICYYDTNIATNKKGNTGADASGHSSIPEVQYLHGYTEETNSTTKQPAFYGEDSRAADIEKAGRAIGLGLDDEEFAHYSVAAARYSEWIEQGLNQFKAHGIYNVEYVLPFTETGYAVSGDPTHAYDEWMLMVIALHDHLKAKGTRSEYKFIGPAQSIYAYQNRLSFVEYVYSRVTGTDYENMLDINAMHQYTQPHTRQGYASTVYEPYGSYAMAEDNFSYYNDVLVNSGVRDMPFWCDEYFAHAKDAKWWDNVGMQMTQFAAGMTAGINNGVNRFLTWQMFDTLWDSNAVHGNAIETGSSEFSGGIHAVGTCPSLVHVDGKVYPKGENCDCTKNYNISSYVPRTTYYGINIIGKYLNNENASVYNTEVLTSADTDDGGLYVSAINNDEGKLVILVVNTKNIITSVNVQLDENVSKYFDRYTYDPATIKPTAEAKSLPSDKKITCEGTDFLDIIPPRSFAIYVSTSSYKGDDVDMPMD